MTASNDGIASITILIAGTSSFTVDDLYPFLYAINIATTKTQIPSNAPGRYPPIKSAATETPPAVIE